MNVSLYKNSAPPNKINKKSSLTNERTFENVYFTEKGTLDILHPTVLLKVTNDIGDISNYNYMYIGKFSRYYYIESISTEGGLIRITGRVDALMSHRQDILASEQYITRSQSVQNRYLVDPLLPISSQHKYFVKTFGSPVFDEHCTNVILETIGKGAS